MFACSAHVPRLVYFAGAVFFVAYQVLLSDCAWPIEWLCACCQPLQGHVVRDSLGDWRHGLWHPLLRALDFVAVAEWYLLIRICPEPDC